MEIRHKGLDLGREAAKIADTVSPGNLKDAFGPRSLLRSARCTCCIRRRRLLVQVGGIPGPPGACSIIGRFLSLLSNTAKIRGSGP
jgi:hypothetical protein